MSLRVRVEKQGELWFEATLAAPLSEDDALPLLDLLEVEAQRAGRKMPFGCRGGSCGTCHLEIVEGLEHLEGMAPIEEDTVGNFGFGPRIRLSCRARLKVGASGTMKISIPVF